MKTVENDVEGHEQCLRGIPGTSQTCWGTGKPKQVRQEIFSGWKIESERLVFIGQVTI